MIEGKAPRGGKRAGAGRKPGSTSEADIASLIEALQPVKVGRNDYTRLDRYRDFNRVFFGTPEGKRVLSQIVDACEGPPLLESELTNHALLAARAWTRRIGTLISAWASVQPSDQSTQG